MQFCRSTESRRSAILEARKHEKSEIESLLHSGWKIINYDCYGAQQTYLLAHPNGNSISVQETELPSGLIAVDIVTNKTTTTKYF